MIDIIGLGAGVYDRCKELGLPLRGINVGECAASRENCAGLRDELWFKGPEWSRIGHAQCHRIAELTSPTYAFTSTGKIVVESNEVCRMA
jgi:phage terminase large subunit